MARFFFSSCLQTNDSDVPQHGLTRQILFGLLLVLGLFYTSITVLAQSAGGDFVLSATTINGGGGLSTGGDFSLVGTIALPEASSQQSSGGGFLLAGGFWASARDKLFSDGFEGN